MPKKEILVTKEGLEKLKEELRELCDSRRPEVIVRIKTAKEYGDLSENSEYAAAKDDQSFVEGRIQELEQLIKNAKVVESHKTTGKGSITISSKVSVEIDGDNDSFELVGPTESDPTSGKISTDSPVGKALLGHKTGDSVAVQTPDGKITYKIISVA